MYRIKVYKAKDGWRWNLRAKNGRIIAESGEAYRREKACLKIAYRLLGWIGNSGENVRLRERRGTITDTKAKP